MEKVNVDEMGTGIQNEVPETVNVTEKADKSHNLTVGESLLLIVIMGVIGFGLWAGGSYIVEEIYPEFVRPLVCCLYNEYRSGFGIQKLHIPGRGVSGTQGR